MDVMKMFDLSGQKALVTGGGQGIGRAMAFALAEAGADVAVAQRRGEVAEQTAADINQLGRDSLAIAADVTVAADVARMVAETKARFGRIDILVNNAGVAQSAPVLDTSETDWDSMLGTNLKSVFLCCKSVAPGMLAAGSGSIINTGSMSGFIVNHPQPQASYNASKAAVHHLTKSLAMEWAAGGIRVNAVAPGYIDTAMSEKSLHGAMGAEWLARTPMRRAGDVAELKGVTVFLASQAASFVTGEVIVVDGGYCCW
jgi:NAD(P)-dependent dehydrogenase (short-subunit alcohol dehydrogenase family)